LLAILVPLGKRLLDSFVRAFTTRGADDFHRFRRFGDPFEPGLDAQRVDLGAPARSEAAFTRALQARRYDVAWQLLAPSAQQAWRDSQAFAAEMATGGPTRIERSRLKDIRILSRWEDPDAGLVHDRAAELQIEYHLSYQGRRRVVEKVLHLVDAGSGWKNLVYPSRRLRHTA
jgi:hypothetical protein